MSACDKQVKENEKMTYLTLLILLPQCLYTSLMVTTICLDLLVGEIELRRVDCSVC